MDLPCEYLVFDVCEGTYACECSNGHSMRTDLMPWRPGDKSSPDASIIDQLLDIRDDNEVEVVPFPDTNPEDAKEIIPYNLEELDPAEIPINWYPDEEIEEKVTPVVKD